VIYTVHLTLFCSGS